MDGKNIETKIIRFWPWRTTQHWCRDFLFRFSKSQSLPKTLFFSISEVEFLSAYSQTLLPQESGFPDLEKAEVIRRLDEEFFFVDSNISDDFRSLIFILEYLPLVKGYWSRFSRLSEEDRKNFLLSQETTESDTIRAALTNLKLRNNFV